MSASSPSNAKKLALDGKSGVFDRRRRKTARYYANFQVIVVSLGENGYQQVQGQSQDLSEAGIGILMSSELALGEVVTIGFTLAPVLFELRAVVRHRRACRYGLEFLGMTAEQKQRVAEFVKDLPAAD